MLFRSRRPPHGLLASTLELPGTLWTAEGPGEEVQGAAPVVAHWRRLPGEVEQVFTHFVLRLTLYAAEIGSVAPPMDGAIWVEPEATDNAGFSSVMLKALAHARRAVEVVAP